MLARIDEFLGLVVGVGTSSNGLLSSLFNLATLVPAIAVGVRRLHDVDRSGWWLLLPIPAGVGGVVIGLLIGTASGSPMNLAAGFALVSMAVAMIVLFVFQVIDGDHGANRFGDDPKAPEGEHRGSE